MALRTAIFAQFMVGKRRTVPPIEKMAEDAGVSGVARSAGSVSLTAGRAADEGLERQAEPLRADHGRYD
ncbi:hypothetical protein [Caballeronia choica]|uniref:hypothetical protein n=1 Tax=Caballeronia choica TaxID=326476 RepID=UPI000A5AA670|nr:hypothetical protein [Caballeronia choica]